MPNKKAKDKKRQRILLTKQWKEEGRTAKQYKKWLEKNKNKNIHGR